MAGTWVAGPYVGTYNASSLGQQADGFNLDFVHLDELVSGDNLAEAVQDMITRGTNAYLDGTARQYSAAAIGALIWPIGSTFGTIGQVGRVCSSAIGGVTIAKPMVLTAVAGTTASAAPATLTAALCRLATGFPVRLLFAPRNRDVPWRVQTLPDSSSVLFALT